MINHLTNKTTCLNFNIKIICRAPQEDRGVPEHLDTDPAHHVTWVEGPDYCGVPSAAGATARLLKTYDPPADPTPLANAKIRIYIRIHIKHPMAEFTGYYECAWWAVY